jgi:predicted esterase
MSHKLNFIHKYIPSPDPASEITLSLLHGTGVNEESFLSISNMILPQASVISPRGQILENGMPRFFRRLSEGVFDLPDWRMRTKELAEFIESSAQNYELESNKVIAVGYSNGANIASSVMFTFPKLISKAVLYHPMIPFVPDTTPDLSDLKVLIKAGTNDPIVRAEETIELQKLFENYGAHVEIYWHDMGHNLTREEIDRTSKFLSES